MNASSYFLIPLILDTSVPEADIKYIILFTKTLTRLKIERCTHFKLKYYYETDRSLFACTRSKQSLY